MNIDFINAKYIYKKTLPKCKYLMRFLYLSCPQTRRLGYNRLKLSYVILIISKSKVSDHSRGWPEGSLFDSYYTKV